jgi:hypothetical protein
MQHKGLSLDAQLWWLEKHATELSLTYANGQWTCSAVTDQGTVTETSTKMYEASTKVFDVILPEAKAEVEVNKIRDLFSAVLPSLVDNSMQEQADDALEDEDDDWTDDEAES